MAKILTIDDAWPSRQMIGKILKTAEHQVVEADNGKNALLKLNSYTPDCIILDLLMPEMDGFDFLVHLKQINYDVPVIVISADTQQSSRSKALRLGASKMLNKPPKFNELLMAVEELTYK
jgi:DNA-binding response OmpR family regulator